MMFRSQTRAPLSPAVQAGTLALLAGLLLAQAREQPLPPAACGSAQDAAAAQIRYQDGATACYASQEAMLAALAAPDQPGFVRAVYVRAGDGAAAPSASWRWLDQRTLMVAARRASLVTKD
ncbi:hypothetical protein [Pseudoduganella aquatica]|uniref:hypothetical protein n=1 Tax=Pseudoduganella aquatica TaxID=2660641 RepID=UPI001E2D4257|nr:hypothetical protein [Pseudoduganella aquatica]